MAHENDKIELEFNAVAGRLHAVLPLEYDWQHIREASKAFVKKLKDLHEEREIEVIAKAIVGPVFDRYHRIGLIASADERERYIEEHWRDFYPEALNKWLSEKEGSK